MASSVFPTITTGVTVETATNGSLTGDGSSGDKLSVTGLGSDTQVLFNDGGPIGANAGLTFDKTNDVLALTGQTTHSADLQLVAGNDVGAEALLEFKHLFGGAGADWDLASNDAGDGDFNFTVREDTDGTYKVQIQQGTTGDMYLQQSGGKVGIGNAAPAEALDVTGTIKGGGYKSSDGTAGMTTTTTVAGIGVKTITIKNGLITSIA